MKLQEIQRLSKLGSVMVVLLLLNFKKNATIVVTQKYQ